MNSAVVLLLKMSYNFKNMCTDYALPSPDHWKILQNDYA